MLNVFTKTLGLLFILCSLVTRVSGQPVLPYNLEKPKKFENKKLGSEKSTEKKFRGTRRFIQNTVTHYNWYFNANNKLNEIVERAKLANKDDYTQLLPFYNYSLDRTASDKTELDSVIYKTNAGVLIHDLRNAWIDNLYMLMGKAYFFRNDLDSAYKTFQYINFVFAPKDDGLDLAIGSNSNEGGNAFSISTKEKSTFASRVITTPPSRNESFIWQIRTFIEKGAMIEAASLIQTLRNDPVFPERLHTDLNEVQAHWFYNSKNYDSAAFYLERSLDNAEDRSEKARWEFLIGQLYALAHQTDNSQKWYKKAIDHTLDPVLEVYARLNSIRQNMADSATVQKNIEELQRMGRKDKYVKYRDIIFYNAALMELDRHNIAGAKAMLLKATQAAATATPDNINPLQRTRSFLLLADISYDEKQFVDAKRFYDSINNNDPGITDVTAFDRRKQVLGEIVEKDDIIRRQDSLQGIAAMKPAEREALLKKMARQLRRKQGLKEEENTTSGNAATGMNEANEPPPDLFGSNSTGDDWYFANASLKSKGLSTFKQRWGNRPNVDNWRRIADVSGAAALAQSQTGEADSGSRAGGTGSNPGNYITAASLMKNLPLTPELLEKSQDSVSNAMVDLGIIYIDKLEEYPAAIDTLEKFCSNFPYSNRKPEALYYLYYAYKKTGRNEKALAAQQELNQKYSGTRYQQGVDNAVTGAGDRDKQKITEAYDKVYNLFIEGNFTAALDEKKVNDSLFGSSYWTPQLLYIEAVYFMHSRQDEQAKKTLTSITDLYPESPMSAKAKAIMEVLSRRKEIEDYLTKLEIKRVEDSVTHTDSIVAVAKPVIGTPLQQDTTRLLPKKMSLADSLAKIQKPAVTVGPPTVKKDSVRTPVATAYSFHVEAPHAVALLLIKVDPVYVSESRNAFNRYNMTNFYNQKIDINIQPLSDSVNLVVMSGFDNAALAKDYFEKTRAVAATQIVPWLPAPKYSFMLISLDNIEVLKNRKDIGEYRKFEEKYFPKN